MKLQWADVPPAGNGRAGQQFRRQLLPDKRLNTVRRNEILFKIGQGVGEIGKRADEMGASARRRTLAQEFRSLPECLHSTDRLSGKVMGADEERIIVQRLRTRRLVVCIVQANESISEKRCELTARLVNLRR